MSAKIPVIAIVGRTNVGKSSLFNALIGYRVAVVEDVPGVTRDRNYALVRKYSFPFSLIDTGGLVGDEIAPNLLKVIRDQTDLAIQEADLVVALFDGAYGVHQLDIEVVDILRRSGKPIIWAINKTESSNVQMNIGEFYQLGIGELVSVSAAHRQGLDELVDAIGRKLAVSESTVLTPDQADPGIRIAIIGKPNVGKSSLLNKIIGHERVVASELPGSTTDNIDVSITKGDQKFTLVDTAGLRRAKRVEAATVERYSNLRSLRALVSCDIALVVLDANEPASDQDIKIAELVHERGRGLIFVINKWDRVEKDHRTVHAYKEDLRRIFRFAQYAPIVFVSALSGRRCSQILDLASAVYANARVRVPTSELNRIMTKAFIARPPPVHRGEPIKLFFATQVSVAPPHIILFLNSPKKVPDSYARYLKGVLRQSFPFEGVDIKIDLRKRTEKQNRKIESAHAGDTAIEPAEIDPGGDEETAALGFESETIVIADAEKIDSQVDPEPALDQQ